MNTKKQNNFALSVFENIKNPTKVFCVDSNGDTITYGDLEARTRKFAHLLKHRHQVGPGKRVAITIDDCVDWPVLFLALILLGANPILLFSNMIEKDIHEVMDRCQADWLLCEKHGTVYKSINKKDLLCSAEIYQDAHHWDDTKTCWWALSSGSGGRHKIIVQNHASFTKLYELADKTVGVNQQDVVLCTAKMAFPYGLAQLYWVLKNNATLCLINKTPAPSLVFKMIQKHKVTRLNVGPYLLNAMCESKNKIDLGQLKVICSGEYLSPDLRTKAKQNLGCRIHDTYGATEVWTTISFQDDPDTNDMGPIIPGVDYKLIDGELYIRHPLQAMMYWNDPEATGKVFQQDWVATGDAVKIVDDRLTFLGRVDDMIKVKGTFVSTLYLEDAIKSSPDVDECMVGVDKSGAVAEIVVLVKFSGQDKTVSSLRKYLRGIMPTDKLPKYIEPVIELPKTINNKFKRNLTRQIDYSK